MPDAEATTLRVGSPIAVGDATLRVVERVELHSHRGRAGMWILAALQPHALLVRDRHGLRAYDACAAPIPLAQLRQLSPELDQALSAD